MKKTGIVLLGSLALAGASTAPSALGAGTAAGPKVRVLVVDGKRTLVNRSVRGEKRSVTTGGTPRGKCLGTTAAGALDAATGGRWTGKYYASLGDIFVTSIQGVKPAGSHYWSLFVNGKSSSKGICHVKLAAGQRLLFKVL